MKIGRFIGHIFVAFLISFVFSFRVEAATINAANCSSSAVQTAINSASNGDTVIIPNGSCTWTSGLSITKQITLIGANVPTRSSTATDGTTITYNAGSSVLFAFSIGSSYSTTLANLRLLTATSTPGTFVTMSGTGKPPLMHDIYFSLPMGTDLVVDWDVTGGVIWNCTFESTTNTGTCNHGDMANDNIRVLMPNKNWDDASTMGAADTNGLTNVYIEDCIFINCPTIDCDSGCRVVLRHNDFQSIFQGCSHGPTSATGARHVEYYDNTFRMTDTNVNIQRYHWMRGGTGLFTGNSFDKIDTGSCYGTRPTLAFIVENITRTTSHGCCTAWECFHQPGSGAPDGSSGHSYLSSNQTPYDSYQQPEPVYIWGNSGTGNTVALLTSTNDQPDDCGHGLTTPTFFVQGRDYYVSTDSTAAKPGWTRYTYPHPLRQSNPPPSGSSPSPPQNLQIQP